MEIRNNTPSFGMSLKTNSVAELTKYVRNYASTNNEKQIAKGFKQIAKELDGYKHFDVVDDGSKFVVTPKTERATDMYTPTNIGREEKHPHYFDEKEKAITTRFDEEYTEIKEWYQAKHGISRKLAKPIAYIRGSVAFIKAMSSYVKAGVVWKTNPKYDMPDALRKATATAKELNEIVERQLAMEEKVAKALKISEK